jgi:photosystem II protein PsbQ
MVNYRSILSVILALVMVVVVNLGNVAEAKRPTKPVTYTSEQLENIQGYVNDLAAIRDRMPELAKLIQEQNWTFTRNYIHGPLGEIRIELLNVSRNLLPDLKPQAYKLSKDIFSNLVTIDEAAAKKNYKLAIRNYAETVQDLDEFLKLSPVAPAAKPEPPKPPAATKPLTRKSAPKPPEPKVVEPEVTEPAAAEPESEAAPAEAPAASETGDE